MKNHLDNNRNTANIVRAQALAICAMRKEAEKRYKIVNDEKLNKDLTKEGINAGS